MKKQYVIILVLAVAAGFILAGLLVLAKHSSTSASGSNDLVAVTADEFGGPYTLIDHNSKTVTNKDYEGQYKLMYFGFTFCPAICPTELQKITVALNKMGEDAKAVHPLFITVDPERDTPQKMKDYIGSFHPSITGLSGSQAQVSAMLKAYKIYAAKVQDPSMTEYTMDHSTFIYFIGPDGRLLHIFKLDDTADDLAATMTAWIKQGQTRP